LDINTDIQRKTLAQKDFQDRKKNIAKDIVKDGRRDT
jgi:hypothetical protein